MSLYDQVDALESSPLGTAIKSSTWLFPAIESVHLLALALLGGTILLLDLRLLGMGLTSQPASAIERQTRPWQIGAIVVMLATGALLGVSEAVKLYDKQAFWVKMAALLGALIFTFAVRNPLARRDPGPMGAVLALVSLSLWLTVAIAGRWIGFS